MTTAFTFFLAVFGTVTFILTLKRIAHRFGLTDRPNSRKVHEGAVPLVGGIAIFLSFAICLAYLDMIVPMRYFLLAGGLLLLVGVVDDASEVTPVVRLVLHVASALIMCILGGVVVMSFGQIVVPGFEVTLGPIAIPFTVFAVVALINAVNLSDGLDGLAGTQTLIPLVGLAWVAYYSGDVERFLPLVALCGCVLGFLYFNFRTPWNKKATVFLGDAGSSFLGFALAWFLIDLTQGDDANVYPVAALWFALLIIYSTVEIVSRRIVRRRSPFKPDREHLHHVFLLAGFSVRETVWTLSAITLAGVAVGIVSTLYNAPENVLFIAFVTIGLVFLRMIFKSWKAMRFLYRSICRRRTVRRKQDGAVWDRPERRMLKDRRQQHLNKGDNQQV